MHTPSPVCCFVRRSASWFALMGLLFMAGCNGGGSNTNTNNPTAPNLTAAVSSTGTFAPNEQNATYSITVSNAANALATNGTVTVADPPTGFSVTAIAGNGWSCTLATLTCTRSDALAAGQSYPAITVTGNVTATAGQSVSVPVSISGGGLTTNVNNNGSVSVAAAALTISKTHTGNFTQGQQNATYTVTVSNGAGAGPTVGTVTVTDTAPSGETLVSMAGTGWTCPPAGNTCTRSDALAAGQSYAAITVTVNVSFTAASPQVNQVGVSGGGSANNNKSDSTTITPNPPVLTINKAHVGAFTQGQQNATYTVTVSNTGTAPTNNSSAVEVTDTVPSGETLVSMAGTGWTCPGLGGANTCDRGDTLAPASSYPAITVTVNVAANASSPQVNNVSVVGGGAAMASHGDSTTILVPQLGISKSHSGNFSQGQQNATYSVTVTNNGTAPTNGTAVEVTDTVPSGETLVSMAGTGWTCPGLGGANTCDRNDALATATSYPAITVTVNVASNATTPQVNQVSVSGGGSANSSNSDSTTIIEPVLNITKMHTGNFTQGQQNATYTVTVTNNGTAPTNGTGVEVTDTVPSGETLVSMAGTGWTCPGLGGANTCDRSDALATATSYPAITVTVNVAANASSPQVNQVSVSGGGSALNSNSDSTTITPTNPCAGGPSGNESLLNGQYAIMAQGFQGTSQTKPVVIGASFAANGSATSNITGGELDINTASGHQHVTINSTGSSYVVGLDTTSAGNAGCMTLSLSNSTTITFRFSLGGVSGGVAGKGRIIEYDDLTGSGNHVTGVLRKQDTTAFSGGNTSALHANYAFGLNGVDPTGGPFAIAGSLVLNSSTGLFTGGAADIDDAGTVQSNVTGSTGGIASVSPSTGRAILTYVPNLTGATQQDNAAYIVNANELFFVNTDSFLTNAMYAGRAVASASSYTSSSLNGNFIIQTTGTSSCTVSGMSAICSGVNLGLLTVASSTSTTGTVNGTLFEYDIQNGARSKAISGGSYSLTSSTGRVTLASVGTNPPVLYMASPASNTEPISFFIVGSDSNATAGFGDVGAASNITTSSLAGNYLFGVELPGDSTVSDETGVVSVSSAGALNGTAWQSGQGGLGSSAVNAGNGAGPVTIDNASGPGTGNVGTGTVAVTNGTTFYFIDEGGGPGKITVVDHQ